MTLLSRLLTYRRARTARGATLAELTLLSELLDTLTTLRHLAREASRPDSTASAVQAARDEMVRVALTVEVGG